MENAINCVALFYKVGLKKDFFLYYPFVKLCFYLFFNINIESRNNYIPDDFEASKKKLTVRCYFSMSLAFKGKNRSF